jgi:hypothetical protein
VVWSITKAPVRTNALAPKMLNEGMAQSCFFNGS